MDGLLRHWVRSVLRYRALYVLLVLALSGVAVYASKDAVVSSSIEAMFFGSEHQRFQKYKELVNAFGSDEAVIIAIEGQNPYAEPNRSRLERIHKGLESKADIDRVFGPSSFSRMGLVGDTIAERKFSDLAKDQAQADSLLAELRADPEAGGLLISKDHLAFLVIVSLTPSENRDAENAPKLVDEIVQLFLKEGVEANAMYVGGLTAVHGEIVRQSRANLERLFPLVLLVLLLAVFLMFGRWWPVLVNTVSALIAVLWAMAFSITLNPHINIMITLVPALVMIISFSDVVHLCSAYLLELERGEDKWKAIEDATVDVGQACLLTSLTTAVGFISMTFIPTPVFQELGVAAAFGVFAAFLLAMTIVPVLLSLIPEPTAWREGKNRVLQVGIDRLLDACIRFTTTRPYTIIVGFALLFGVLLAGVLQITFETEFMKRLSENNQVRSDQQFFESHFSSVNTIELYIDTQSEEGVLDADFFNTLAAYESALESMPSVAKVVSIVDVLRATHGAIAGPEAQFLPLEGDAIAQMMVVVEMGGMDVMRPYVDFSRRQVHLTVYVEVDGIRGIYERSQEFANLGEAMLPSGVVVEGTGFQSLMGDWVSDIITGQRTGLMFSLLVIALLLIIGFRSFRMGLISMIPNVLPLLAVGGWVGWTWDLVDTDTLIVGMIAIGIGVDDTIHFLSRYQIEAQRQDDVVEAIAATFHFSGRGIFMTTFIFTLGFAPLVLSEYLSIQFMGTLLPYSFVVAVLADLLLVPALVKVGWLR